jgi:methyl coenzyme M reductase subunit D
VQVGLNYKIPAETVKKLIPGVYFMKYVVSVVIYGQKLRRQCKPL